MNHVPVEVQKQVGTEVAKQIEREIQKAMLSPAKTTSNVVSQDGNWTITIGDTGGGWRYVAGTHNPDTVNVFAKQFIPTKVIFSCPATICFFPDGTKTMVKCAEDEEFIKEEGVMACIMKKIFASRNQFKKLVNSGYENTDAVYERLAYNEKFEKERQINKEESVEVEEELLSKETIDKLTTSSDTISLVVNE